MVTQQQPSEPASTSGYRRPSHFLRHRIEVLLARVALALIPRLSRQSLLACARALGRVGYSCCYSLRRVGLTNLGIAFPDLEPVEHRRILQASFRNFALVILDTFWFSRRTGERIRAFTHFDLEGFAPLLRPAPQICITAHYGNWEVLGMAFAALGHPLTSVAAPIENPRIDDLINQLRTRTGQKIVSKHGAFRQLLKTLRQGGKIALLLDQNTKPVDGGRFVPFFGLPVLVSGAAAALWRRTGAEVYVTMSMPCRDGHYRFPRVQHVPPPVEMDPESAELEMTRRITATVEGAIRDDPSHWLWTYKRWKYVPPGAKCESYPYYAKTAS